MASIMPLRRAAPPSAGRAALTEAVSTRAEASRRLSEAQSALTKADAAVLEAAAAADSAEAAIDAAAEASIAYEAARLMGTAGPDAPLSIAEARDAAGRANDRLDFQRKVRERLDRDVAGAEADARLADQQIDAALRELLPVEMRERAVTLLAELDAASRRYADLARAWQWVCDHRIVPDFGPGSLVGSIEIANRFSLVPAYWAVGPSATVSAWDEALARLRTDATATLPG